MEKADYSSTAASASADVIDLTETDDEATIDTRCVISPLFRSPLPDETDVSRERLPFACNDSEEDQRQHAVPTAASLFALSDDEHADNVTTQSSVPAGWMDRPRDAAHSSASLSLLRDSASLMSSFEERSSASQEHTTSRQSRKRKKQVSPTRKQPPTSPHPAHRHAYSPHSTSMSPFASLPPLSPYSSSPFSVSPPLYYPPLPPVPPLFGSDRKSVV